jgi:Na+-transporting NADH:ubiquinone oxidoreductase subunit A
MTQKITLKRGFDIKIEGEALRFTNEQALSRTYAIKPKDFKGIVPKLALKAGEEVKAGEVLFYSKTDENLKFTSPVSGEIVEIKRGPKRVIEEIKILSDANIQYKQFGASNPSDLSDEEIKTKMLDAGCWPFVRQRPFSTIADFNDSPKAIFISGFDSAPLGVDYNYLLENEAKDFNTGLEAISKLTEGKVHLGLDANAMNCDTLTHAKGVEVTEFDGPHPAGNVGIQIHHVDPIRKGDLVWYVNPYDLVIIGRLFNEGVYNTEKAIVLCGSEVEKRSYYKFRSGASIESIVSGNVTAGNNRFISGNVLTGTQIPADGFLSFYDYQVTVIPEGDESEFLGWLIPSYPRPSNSMTLPAYLKPNAVYKVNTNQHGEERALVLYGEYEKVLPMDIFPTHLVSKCMAESMDIEWLEKLGIYEVAPEDMALCEFVCTSKVPVQELIEKGLVLVENEA